MNFKLTPTPGALVHFITVFAVVTLQLVAVYSIPLGPYVAYTELPVGPMSVPVIVISVVPFVVSVPANAVTAGGAYVTVAVDVALV